MSGGGWEVTMIKEVTESLNRRRVPLSAIERQHRKGSYRYFGAQGVIDYVDDYLFDGDFILVAEDGENLRSRKQPVASLVSGRFWVNNHSHILKVDEGVTNRRFLMHALNQADISGLVTGAAQPKLTKASLGGLQVQLPVRAVQDRVASVLAAFDELIEIIERRIELLEDLARSLYREWFVRFRFPGFRHGQGAPVPGLLPESWTVARLGDVATLRYGKSLPAARRRPGHVAVVSSAGVIGEHDEAVADGPGVVVGRKGNVGSVWWIDRPFFPIDTTYYVETEGSLGLLYWQLQELPFVDSHAAVPGLSREQAYNLPVVVPPRALAERFEVIHRGCFDQVGVLRASNEKLATTRDLLLPRLVTARLDISDVDLGDLLPDEAEA